MTGEQFTRWIAAMIKAGKAEIDADCAKLLKIAPRTITYYKRRGGTHILKLACAYLLAN